jgi:hypothetical protein
MYQPKHSAGLADPFPADEYRLLANAYQMMKVAAKEAQAAEKYSIEFLCREAIVDLGKLATLRGVLLSEEQASGLG